MKEKSLLPFQKYGVNYLLSRKFALLADDMGLGKTVQAVTAARRLNLFKSSKAQKKVVVIAPAVALYNWQKEIKAWSGNNTVLPIVDAENVGNTFLGRGFICSFNFARDHLFNRLHTLGTLDLLIIDECHYLKNPLSFDRNNRPKLNRTKAVLGPRGIIHKARRCWALSGTPMPNHIGEMWPILRVFNATDLNYQKFLERYCVFSAVSAPTRRGGIVTKDKIVGTDMSKKEEIRGMLKGVMLRRKKRDNLQLPPITRAPFYIKGKFPKTLFKNMDEKRQREIEERVGIMEKELEMVLSDSHNIMEVLAATSQSLSSMRRFHAYSKVLETVELISNEVKSGAYRKLVVFGYYTGPLELLNKLLQIKGMATYLVTGAVPPKKRFEMQEAFQRGRESNRPQIFIGNIIAAGVNLTLTKASNVIFLDQDWVPGSNAQATDRIDRYGQKENMHVRYVTIANSVDEKVNHVLIRKMKEIGGILG